MAGAQPVGRPAVAGAQNARATRPRARALRPYGGQSGAPIWPVVAWCCSRRVARGAALACAPITATTSTAGHSGSPNGLRTSQVPSARRCTAYSGKSNSMGRAWPNGGNIPRWHRWYRGSEYCGGHRSRQELSSETIAPKIGHDCRLGFNEQIFGTDKQDPKGGCGLKNASGPGNSARDIF